MSAGLVRLSLWRVLPRSFWIGATALLLVLAWRVPESVPEGLETVLPALADGHRRQTVWALALVLFLPLLVSRSAGLARTWRASDVDWFAPLPVARSRYVLSSSAALALAAFLAAGSTTLASELFAAGTPARRVVRTLEHPAFLAVEGHGPLRWSQADLDLGACAPGSALLLRPTVAPGSGPAVTVRATLEDAHGQRSSTEQRVFGRTRLLLPIPAGARGAASVTLERVGPGAVLALPRESIDLLLPSGGATRMGLELLLRLFLAFLAWNALACGLGAWMRPVYATGTTLALALPGGPQMVGANLAETWLLAGEGLAPPAIGTEELLVALALCAAGSLLFARALGRGREEP